MKPFLTPWSVYAELPEPDKRSIYDAPGVARWFDRLFEMAVFETRSNRLTGYYLLDLKAREEVSS